MSDNDLIDRFRELLDTRLDAQTEVSKAHWGALEQRVADGFAGTNSRLDKVNGQLDKHRARISALEAGRGHLHQRASDPAVVARAHARSEDGKAITRRDVAVGVACSGLAIAAVLWVLQIAGKL